MCVHSKKGVWLFSCVCLVSRGYGFFSCVCLVSRVCGFVLFCVCMCRSYSVRISMYRQQISAPNRIFYHRIDIAREFDEVARILPLARVEEECLGGGAGYQHQHLSLH